MRLAGGWRAIQQLPKGASRPQGRADTTRPPLSSLRTQQPPDHHPGRTPQSPSSLPSLKGCSGRLGAMTASIYLSVCVRVRKTPHLGAARPQALNVGSRTSNPQPGAWLSSLCRWGQAPTGDWGSCPRSRATGCVTRSVFLAGWGAVSALRGVWDGQVWGARLSEEAWTEDWRLGCADPTCQSGRCCS